MFDDKPDPVMSGFFRKYGGTRARPDGSPSNEFIIDQILTYRTMLHTGRHPNGVLMTFQTRLNVSHALDHLMDEAKSRHLVIQGENQ
jgi:hypothetical protein